MIVQDRKNNISINLLCQDCLKRDCYTPRIAVNQGKIIYVCGKRILRGCPAKYKEEHKLKENKKIIKNYKRKEDE